MPRALTVTEITRAVKNGLEACFPYPVEVEGEISNFRPHYSGHAYFTIKDSYAQLSAVMWKSRVEQLRQPLENGQQVVCTGQITVYEKTGRYQLNALSLRPVGKGDLQARFEALKHKLWEAGYFDEARKRPLPAYPQRIGLITSPTGAAIQDFLSIARRRNPSVQVVVRPAQVQGERAAPDLIAALEDLNRWGQLDLLVIGRGGGSLEDLWAFNDEALAEAIYRSNLPVVSAVGHEVDFTIADWVADRRAATPSAAAELVIPRRDEMLGQLLYYQERSTSLLHQHLQQRRQELRGLIQHHAFQRPRYLLETRQQQLQRSLERLQQRMQQQLQRHQQQLAQRERQLQALNPLKVLARGFAQIEQQGKTIGLTSQLQDGPARVYLADGSLEIEIKIRKQP